MSATGGDLASENPNSGQTSDSSAGAAASLGATQAGSAAGARAAHEPAVAAAERQLASGRDTRSRGGTGNGLHVAASTSEDDSGGGYGKWLRGRAALAAWLAGAIRQVPCWLVSAVVHLVVLLFLALLTLPEGAADDVRQLVVSTEDAPQLEEIDPWEPEPLEEIPLEVAPLEGQTGPQQLEVSVADDLQAAAVQVELEEFGLEHAPRNDLLAAVGAYSGTALSGRGSGKGQLVRKYGGSAGSERAVAAALQWLAEHQMPDGGWSFAHQLAPRCNGRCRNPGQEAPARIAATAMALLPFLGAGQTHQSGKYKEVVGQGLYFLTSRMRLGPQGGSLWEPGGRMYSHGLASIALCEAYAMTHDKALHRPAQAAINFIAYAQDPVGGGWRYEVRQRGDTSVVGWQLMALKSGYMAYLAVDSRVVGKAIAFLDSVQADGGAYYGYTGPGQGKATTAIGLLCRMYLGWNRDNPALKRGVAWLSQQGPSPGNMYYNYYATQVMRHWGGELWKKWNQVMRDQLVNAQSQSGHETGSWFFPDGDHGARRGGRLYATSMATMILEVYYRHLPIYRKQSTDEAFTE